MRTRQGLIGRLAPGVSLGKLALRIVVSKKSYSNCRPAIRNPQFIDSFTLSSHTSSLLPPRGSSVQTFQIGSWHFLQCGISYSLPFWTSSYSIAHHAHTINSPLPEGHPGRPPVFYKFSRSCSFTISSCCPDIFKQSCLGDVEATSEHCCHCFKGSPCAQPRIQS
jgi:hypothetical protein